MVELKMRLLMSGQWFALLGHRPEPALNFSTTFWDPGKAVFESKAQFGGNA